MIASFWEHAEALRQTLVKIILTIFAGFFLTCFFYQPLLQFLCKPIISFPLQIQEVRYRKVFNGLNESTYTLAAQEQLIEKTPLVQEIKPRAYLIPHGESLLISYTEKDLKFFGPLEGMIATLKVSLWIAIAFTSPIWLYLILTFIAPTLKKESVRELRAFWAYSVVLFFLGVFFAWKVSIPWANQILKSFNQGLGENLWGFSHYLDYTLVLLFATGTAFEGASLLLFLVHIGKLSAEQLKIKRRHAIVAIFIISAILTPPDVLTQFMLAIPLMLLYECVILYASICARRHNRAGRDHLTSRARDQQFPQTLPTDL